MVTTSNTSNAPWIKAQPYVTAGMTNAQRLYNQGKGFNAPNFQTYVPFSAQTQGGLDQTWNLAQQGNPLAGSSMATVGGILAGGAQDQKYNQLYQQSAGDYAGQMGKMDQLYSQAGNPYFEQATQIQADKTAADVQRQFGGLGRIGSAADTGALVDQIGNMRTQALSNNWNQNIANQRGILGDENSLYGNYVGNQGNLLSGQTTGQLNAVGAAPGAYQQQYLPAERMGQVGQAYDDLATRTLQAKIDKFNTNQQAGWNRLGAYNQAISGTGGNSPGFAQTKVSQPTNWLGILSGAGLAGASILSGGGNGGTNIFDYLRGT
jgi:hypothetical protein